MKLTTQESSAALEEFGCYITEACDRCGKLLGPVRYTRKGDTGAWCSRECRRENSLPVVVWESADINRYMRLIFSFSDWTIHTIENFFREHIAFFDGAIDD